jgi:microcystin-dependent protein
MLATTANVYGETLEDIGNSIYLKKDGDTATGLIVFRGGQTTEVGESRFDSKTTFRDNVEFDPIDPSVTLDVACPSYFISSVTIQGDPLQDTFVAGVPSFFTEPTKVTSIEYPSNTSKQILPYTGLMNNAGTYTAPTITLASSGQITGISNGVTNVPTGSITMFASLSIPAGWVLCDGTAYPVGTPGSTYYNLSQVIGFTYGSGGGGTSFLVPNLINKIAMGSSSPAQMGITFATSTGTSTSIYQGNQKITSSDMLPKHTHPLPGNSDGNYNVCVGGNSTNDCSTGGDKSRVYSLSIRSLPTATNQNTWSGLVQSDYLPPVCAVLYIIKL